MKILRSTTTATPAITHNKRVRTKTTVRELIFIMATYYTHHQHRRQLKLLLTLKFIARKTLLPYWNTESRNKSCQLPPHFDRYNSNLMIFCSYLMLMEVKCSRSVCVKCECAAKYGNKTISVSWHDMTLSCIHTEWSYIWLSIGEGAKVIICK